MCYSATIIVIVYKLFSVSCAIYNRDEAPNSPAPFFAARLECKFILRFTCINVYRPKGVA